MFNIRQVRLYQPLPNSHKGQNGKLLVIGGSKLFHSSIFWAADAAGRIVDIVHLTSPANENNQVFRKRLKEKFWSGIAVDWGEVENYIEEDDVILIGPGMTRQGFSSVIPAPAGIYKNYLNRSRVKPGMTVKTAGETDNTSFIVNYLLKKYPTKKWVIDGGGLQEVEPGSITGNCILTPHKKEFVKLADKCYKNYKGYNLKRSDLGIRQGQILPGVGGLSRKLRNCTILLKGQVDTVCQGKRCVFIEGGNPGMTKGGTGDVLAGLVAGLYCKNDAWTATTVGSWVNKTAGDNLYAGVGPYFNAADLVKEIPNVLVKV